MRSVHQADNRQGATDAFHCLQARLPQAEVQPLGSTFMSGMFSGADGAVGGELDAYSIAPCLITVMVGLSFYVHSRITHVQPGVGQHGRPVLA